MDRVHLNVNGMVNPQCKISLKNALGKIDGVNMINVDLAECSVEVGYNTPANEREIRSCIENSGYTIS